MSIFTMATGYVAHKTVKVAKGSGGFVKNFVSDVKTDMQKFQELEKMNTKTEKMQRNMVIDGDIVE